MLLLLATIFLTVIACGIAYLAVTFHLKHLKYSHIPGPPLDSFWNGNRKLFQKEFAAGKHFADILLECVGKYGHTFKIFFFNQVFVFTVDEEAVKELMVGGIHQKSPVVYRRAEKVFGQRYLGNGLVTDVDEERWKKRRAVLNQAFHRKFLMSLMDQFNEGSNNMIEKLTSLAEAKSEFPLMQLLSQTTLDVLGKVAFTQDIGSLQNDENSFPKALRHVMEGYAHQNRYPFSRVNPLMWSYRKRAQESAKKIRAVGHKWMHERILLLQDKTADVPDDILSYMVGLMDAVPDLQYEDIVDDFCTFFVAGTETTATLCTFFVMCVNQHPEVQKKVVDEIDSVLGSRHSIQYEDLGKLEYMNMVMKETLRLYPPAPATARSAKKDMVIGGYTVPQDTDIFMSTFVSSRLPEFNKDPLKFDPERFAPDSPTKPNIYTYFPFALGPRICIGQTFAKIEAKAILTKLYQRVNVHVKPDQSFKILEFSTLRPKDDLICTFSMRD